MPMWITRIIDAPAERCWDLLVDTDAWPGWGPTVAEARVDGRPGEAGPAIEGGSTGAVRARVGPWVPFRITEFEAGQF